MGTNDELNKLQQESAELAKSISALTAASAAAQSALERTLMALDMAQTLHREKREEIISYLLSR